MFSVSPIISWSVNLFKSKSSMKLEVAQFLTVVVILSLVDLGVACKNVTRQKRDGPDWGGMAAAGAAMVVETVQKGAGVKSDFKVKMGNEKFNE